MNKVYPVDQDNPSADIVNLAATRLRDGGVLLFPTETVYGLGAIVDKDNMIGSESLFDIKQRPYGIPVPILIPEASDIDRYGKDVSDNAHKLANAFWPGPLTIIVPADDEEVYPEFQAEDGTVGLRCPDNTLVHMLLDAVGPIFATSANTHLAGAPARFEDIEPRIIEAADLALDGGDSNRGVASTIVRCIGDECEVLRVGSISGKEIEDVLNA